MDKTYDHKLYEQEIYQKWEQAGVFNPDKNNSKGKQPFTILMPPPNANDPLHIGHAMFSTVEDVLIRYHRMKGDDTLWQPGTDHAGIETQFVFEKKLKKEGKSRFNYDRETLYQMILDYVEENSEIAVDQLKKLGASADWSRFRFMLDEEMTETVLQTFLKMNDDDLIYRDLRLVNYCPKCGTGFSELEVDHQDRVSKLYYIQYGPFTVATTRPETIFGDTAVAVHPNDERYQKYIGQEVEVDYLTEKRKIKVIADEYVDMEFGTGALKITPLHDPNDYAIWQRHKQELEEPRQIIDFNGRLNEHAGKYQSLKAHIAREQIAKDLDEKGLLIKVDDKYKNNVGVCYRCGTMIEPLPLPQFYVKVKPLIEPVLQGLQNKEFKVHGAGYDKILKHWLEILQDWNISRQIVWGIRMPVWYDVDQNPDLWVTYIDNQGQRKQGLISNCEDDLSVINAGLQELRAPIQAKYLVSTDSPSPSYLQETDTFDTWFSSGQWPITTLKANGDDFDRFYPTQVMETAYDILMFWVMRMLMFGYYLTGQTPFKDIYLHGLIRDAQGKKMSKSKGNVINPLEIVDQYSADALRMALVIRSTAGIDKSVSQHDFKAMRNLTNKIWNASRFVIMNLESQETNGKQEAENGTPDTEDKKQVSGHWTLDTDKEFYQHLAEVKTEVTKHLDELKVGLAADRIYDEFWHWYCDLAIEQAKQGKLSQKAILAGLQSFLIMLHPFMPFVTEAVWENVRANFKNSSELLIVQDWN